MNRPRTRQATLYRLVPEVRGSHEEMFDAYDQYVSACKLDELDADIQFIEVGGTPAIWIGIQDANRTASWCAAASMTTGLELAYTDCRSSGVLLLGVDGTAYVMSYGAGHLLIPDELKDLRFGLRFLIRRLDSDQIRGLVRRRPNKMRFGVEGEALIADIRECARVCREEEPDPALAFVDWIQPVADALLIAGLDAELEELLAGTADAVAERLVPVVPTQVLDYHGQAHSFTVQIGRARPVIVPALEMDCFLRRTRLQRPGERVKALRSGRVYLNVDRDGDDVLDSAPAIKWLEASVAMGPERYFLMDGEWFEIGADYVRTSREVIGRLFPATSSVALPPWSLAANRTEFDYNSYVAARSGGRMLCLDKNRRVRDPLGVRSPLEICDLLGPDNELIHVKRAGGSAPLSHLFSQGLVSAQSLLYGPAVVREQFAVEVARLGRGRVLPYGFTPKKVVFAILMDNGKELSPDILFPFSQVTLAHAAKILGTYGIEVEVLGIPTA